MAEGWDASTAGLLRLPSGRLIRGRRLRLHVAEGSAPNFALYCRTQGQHRSLGRRVGSVVRISDCRATAVTLLMRSLARTQHERVGGLLFGRSSTDRNCPCLHRGAGRRTNRAGGGLRAGGLRRSRGRDAVAASVRGPILDGVTRPVGGSPAGRSCWFATVSTVSTRGVEPVSIAFPLRHRGLACLPRAQRGEELHVDSLAADDLVAAE